MKIKREITIVISTIILSTLGVRAIDHFAPFLTASLRGEKNKEKCPEDMVFVPSPNGGFCIDKYENSPGPNCPFQNPKNSAETRENLNDPNCKPVSVPGAIPWTFISRDQAEIACAKAGKRLPTNEEWYLAALGTPDKSSDWNSNDCHLDFNWPEQPGRTGSGKNCVSSFGAFDMIGNVWEWVRETTNEGKIEGKELPEKGFVWGTDGKGFPSLTDPELPNSDYYEDFLWIVKEGQRNIARGGYWGNRERGGIYSAYIVYLPFQFNSGVGFRCVK